LYFRGEQRGFEPAPAYYVYVYVYSLNLCISFRDHVSNHAVRAQSGCTPVLTLVRQRRLRLFGHIVISDPMLDHHHRAAIHSKLQRPPASWRRPKGHPRLTWTCVSECTCPTVRGLHHCTLLGIVHNIVLTGDLS